MRMNFTDTTNSRRLSLIVLAMVIVAATTLVPAVADQLHDLEANGDKGTKNIGYTEGGQGNNLLCNSRPTPVDGSGVVRGNTEGDLLLPGEDVVITGSSTQSGIVVVGETVKMPDPIVRTGSSRTVVPFDFTTSIATTVPNGVYTVTIRAEGQDSEAVLTDSFTVTVNCESGDPDYTFLGFYEPVKSNDLQVANKVKAGQGVALKWNLYDGDVEKGSEITDLDDYSVKSVNVACAAQTGTPTVDDDPAATAGYSGLRYDEIADLDDAHGQTIFVWKTNRNWANTCREFVVEYDGEELHRALFEFTR
jgi:hypothetical protein